jgi:hypothetical protein
LQFGQPWKGPERRAHPRLAKPFEISWRGASGAARLSRIEDLSLGGCFVEAVSSPSPGDETVVTILCEDEPGVTIAGEVVYVAPGFGFGVRFINLTPEARAQLLAILEVSGMDIESVHQPV